MKLRFSLVGFAAASLAFAAAIFHPAPAAATGCGYLDVGENVTVSDALTTADCPVGSGYADDYRLFAAAGTHLTASLHSRSLGDVLLTIQDFATGKVLAKDREVGNPSATLLTPADAFYIVRVLSVDESIHTGPYVLKIAGVKNTNGCLADTDPGTLCLVSDRFKVQVAWNAVLQGTQGTGTAVASSSNTGSFWFFDSSNTELVIKVLDGRPVNGHFWLFYGALSNIEYTITVTDTTTGTVKTYFNPQNTQASVSDTAAF